MDFSKGEIIGAAGLLVGVIAGSWAYLKTFLNRDQAHLQECLETREEDRKEIKELYAMCSRLEERVNNIGDSQTAIESLTTAVLLAINESSKEVIKAIHESKKDSQ